MVLFLYKNCNLYLLNLNLLKMKILSIITLIAILACAYFLPNYHVHVQEGWGLKESVGNNKSIFNIVLMTLLIFGIFSYYTKNDLIGVIAFSKLVILTSIVDIIFNFIGFTIETSKIISNTGFGKVDKTMPGAYIILILSILNFVIVNIESKKNSRTNLG